MASGLCFHGRGIRIREVIMGQITIENWFYVSLAVNIIFLGWIAFQRNQIKLYRYTYYKLFDWTSRRLDLVLESARLMAERELEGAEVDFPIDDIIFDDIINAHDEFKKLADKHVTQMKRHYAKVPDINDSIFFKP